MKLSAQIFRYIFAIIILISAPTLASNFAAYEGRNAVKEGEGGTKVVKDGIDFWTTGTPPHRYKILGVIEDKRGTGFLSGHAVGDGAIAKQVAKIGGNAVIIVSQNTQVVGAVTQHYGNTSGNNTQGTSTTIPVSKAYTTMIVVQYLDIGAEGNQNSSEPAPTGAMVEGNTPPK